MSFYTLKDIDLNSLSPQDLGELLMNAKNAYYTTGKPIMDDHTYDTLEAILKQKNPHHRIFTKVGNPNFDSGFVKKKHLMPMGSQNKVTSQGELKKYFELKNIPHEQEYLVQPKCDGISLEIIYKDGELIKAITRGDGQTGDVVTQNVVKMQNIVLNARNFTGSVRCEIVVTAKDFKRLPETYSNPRNAASGLTQRLDGLYSEFCSLYAVDVFYNDLTNHVVTEQEKVGLLAKLGFTPVESFLCHNFDEVEGIYQQFFTHLRKEYPYELDGLVIKINNIALQNELGALNNRPKGQVAYKFPAATNTSTILSIDWQVGPLGTVTPVAQIEPVEISGAIITFASLANSDLIEEKGINVGDIVEVSRRGDVIPHIENVVTKVNSGHHLAPTTCPECTAPLIRDHKFLRCPNPDCPAQTLGLLRLYCHVLDIKGISDKTITKLVEHKLITLPGDFYKLQVSDFSDIEGLGEKSGRNIVNEIQAKKTLGTIEVFQAASIPHFSKARVKQLVAAGYDTPEKLLNISIEQLESQPGIKMTLANKIYSGLQLRRPNLESILSKVSIRNSSLEISNLSLTGLSFAITGPLSQPRKTIEQAIESAGGKVVSAVTANTNFLITNESESSSDKFISAKKLNIPILTEEALNAKLA